jgi:hypothetical protein
VAGTDRELPAGRHRIPAVEGQVEEDLLELRPVRPQAAGRRVWGDAEHDLLADQAPEHRREPAHDFVDVQNLGLEYLAVRRG